MATQDGRVVTRLDGRGIEVFSLSDGKSTIYDLETDNLESANSTQALFADDPGAHLLTLSGSARRDLPTQAGAQNVEWSTLLPNGYVVSSGSNSKLWSLSPAGVTTLVASAPDGFDSTGSLGNYIAYDAGPGDACLRTVDGVLVGCSKYLNQDDYEIEMADTGFLVQEYDSAQDLFWLPLSGGKLQTPKTVKLGTDVQVARLAKRVQGARPVLSTVTATGSFIEWLDTTTLTTRRAATGFTAFGGGAPVALTPTDMLLQDFTYGTESWRRAVGSSIGASTRFESLIEKRSSAQASAGRWLVPSGESKLSLYDRGSVKETIPGVYPGEQAIRGLSGPNLLVERSGGWQFRNAAGAWTEVPNAMGIFGGLVLEDVTNYDTGDEAPQYRVRDLSGSGSSPIEFTVPRIRQWWGDLVAYGTDAGCSDGATNSEQDATVVYNFRTRKTVFTTCGELVALGDGFVVVQDKGTTFARDLSTGTQTSLGILTDRQITVDGNRVAYATDSELIIKTIAGVGRSAPRSLGVKAPASYNGTGKWTPEIDLTKPVGLGNLVIKNSAGTTVRSLPVPTSADGSIRNVGWDGKDSTSRVVPKGVYTIELTNTAADGTGAVVRTDGTPGPLAKVAVDIPTLVPGTPSIEGTPTIGATLTAKPGTWNPPSATLTYQWNRNGKAIPGATAQIYKVATNDANTKLTVTVTGKSGTLTASRTSAATATVPGYKLTTTPTPKISGTAKVGKTLTAKAGSWKPSGVAVSYQWYHDGLLIAGATGRTYRLDGLDKGKKIIVRTTGTKSGYAPVTKSSKATKRVTAGTLSNATPKISGTSKVGALLTAKPGTWKPASVTLAYQWYRSGKRISGASTSTYTLVSADKGKRMTVKVTATKPGYTTASKLSKKTAAVK